MCAYVNKIGHPIFSITSFFINRPPISCHINASKPSKIVSKHVIVQSWVEVIFEKEADFFFKAFSNSDIHLFQLLEKERGVLYDHIPIFSR